MVLKTPAPLYEDPIFGGPSDPCVIWNEQEKEWWMFYTQRRVAGCLPGVSAVHGTRIGIAVSRDAKEWLYRGCAEGLEWEWGHNTFWAPEVISADGIYHMFVTYIRGVPQTWTGQASIVHYSSDNLRCWQFRDILDLHSKRVIDACVAETDGGSFKLWYKDEQRSSHTCAAVSRDLVKWECVGEEITDCPHEGPNVFTLGGVHWMITDTWKGLGVYRSEDFIHWRRQKTDLLAWPGIRPGDAEIGNHADVVVSGEEGYLFYFVHPDYPSALRGIPSFVPGEKEHRTVIHCALLRV